MKNCEIVLQDYNSEVVEHLTIPNVLLNAPGSDDFLFDDTEEQAAAGASKEEETSAPETRFFSGDWRPLKQLLRDRGDLKYDLVLTSETIYSEASQPKLLDLFDSFLSDDGAACVLVAAKVHYFGVGGGLRQFEAVLEATGKWRAETVKVVDTGVKREIVKVTRKK